MIGWTKTRKVSMAYLGTSARHSALDVVEYMHSEFGGSSLMRSSAPLVTQSASHKILATLWDISDECH